MLEELKQQVVAVAKEADRIGMCKHKSGNFSMYDAVSGYVVITPSGVARELLTPDDVCVLDLDARVVERRSVARPSSEALMHLYTYRVRPEMRAIVHTHARYSTAFAVMNKEIPAIVYESACITGGRVVPVAPYRRPGTAELAEVVSETLKRVDCCLLQSHGAIAIGTDMEEAFLKAQYVEEVAELYYLTLTAMGGKEPAALPAEELKKWAYPSEIKL